MIVERATRFACSAEQCFAEEKTSRLMLHIAKPLIYFVAIEPQTLPEEWEEREYKVGVKLFGLLPAVGHQIVCISGLDRSADVGHFSIELRDNGYGTLMSTWDHLATIEALDDACLYTDRVDVRAGVFTPLLWLFAWAFYRHRQRRWRTLIRNGFEYGRTQAVEL